MEQNKNLKSLMERAKEFDARLPFMDGKIKGDTAELLGQISTINEYGFLPNEAGEMYVVFTVKERSNSFYFGGAVLTERMVALDQEGYGADIRNDGLPILLTKEVSKKTKRTYTGVTFFPEV